MKADGKGGWKLKGMVSSLFHYQVGKPLHQINPVNLITIKLLGAAFMRDRENGKERPYGGFQADEMGFGSE